MTPFAINPRTGEFFKEDDPVYQGDLIGYTGKTGNAWDVLHKHLHIEVWRNGNKNDRVDPLLYINGDYRPFSEQEMKRTDGKINKIKCN